MSSHAHNLRTCSSPDNGLRPSRWRVAEEERVEEPRDPNPESLWDVLMRLLESGK